eukprot:9478725-Pyramimonas_sp.AAC.1
MDMREGLYGRLFQKINNFTEGSQHVKSSQHTTRGSRSKMLRPEQFAANIGMLFTELPFLQRFEAARAAGFSAVEINTQEMYNISAIELRSALTAANLKLALFNMPAGDCQGDAGLAAQPGREEDFERSLQTTAEYCRELECKAVHCMSGDDSGTTEVNAVSHLTVLLPTAPCNPSLCETGTTSGVPTRLTQRYCTLCVSR